MSFAVYEAIVGVTAGLGAVGIQKSQRNAAQGFNFRGIDDVYNNLNPLLVTNKLCILPRVISRSVDKVVNAKGTTLFYVSLHIEFDFVCATDGSKHTISAFGEAMDSGDKATSKAMSAAYKYAVFQAFCIPTQETAIDADAESHDVPVQPEYVSIAEIKEIEDVAAKHGVEIAAILKAGKISSLTDLQKQKFTSLISWISKPKTE